MRHVQYFFESNDDSTVTTLRISSNLPLTIPEFIHYFEHWLADTKEVYADEIAARKRLLDSGKLVPLHKGD